jgi:hypothetical protein
MSLLLLLRTLDTGAPVFPPPPPSLTAFALPAGGGGVARASAPALRAASRFDTRAPSRAPVRIKDRP